MGNTADLKKQMKLEKILNLCDSLFFNLGGLTATFLFLDKNKQIWK